MRKTSKILITILIAVALVLVAFSLTACDGITRGGIRNNGNVVSMEWAYEYVPRHNSTVQASESQTNTFWEVPFVRAGDSFFPSDGTHEQDNEQGWHMATKQVSSLEKLNLLRVCYHNDPWNPNGDRPIRHSYTEEFFESNALLFVRVFTGSGGFVPFVNFRVLVTCGEYLHPMFSIDLPRNVDAWTTDIGHRSFVIELPRVLLEYYDPVPRSWNGGRGIPTNSTFHWLGNNRDSFKTVVQNDGTISIGITAGDCD